jgi:hypothetical protein
MVPFEFHNVIPFAKLGGQRPQLFKIVTEIQRHRGTKFLKNTKLNKKTALAGLTTNEN